MENGTLIEMILVDQIESEGERGPSAISREMHVEQRDRTSWTIKITGPFGGIAEGIVLPRAGLKVFLERLLAEL